jgi:CheY-like chemotaxis protein
VKILIADDDFDNRSVAKDALEHAHFETLQATNGLEAIEMVLREKPDLVLMDLSMPKLNGWEAAKRLRQMPETRHIPIVAFTAHALIGDDLKAKGAGCDDYISKPCMPADLVLKVKSWLKVK